MEVKTIKNIIVDILTGPLSLPFEPLVAYIIAGIIGIITHSLTFSKVGDLYRWTGFSGSLFGVITYFLIYIVTYVVIYFVVFVVSNTAFFIYAHIVNILITVITIIALVVLVYYGHKEKNE